MYCACTSTHTHNTHIVSQLIDFWFQGIRNNSHLCVQTYEIHHTNHNQISEVHTQRVTRYQCHSSVEPLESPPSLSPVLSPLPSEAQRRSVPAWWADRARPWHSPLPAAPLLPYSPLTLPEVACSVCLSAHQHGHRPDCPHLSQLVVTAWGQLAFRVFLDLQASGLGQVSLR